MIKVYARKKVFQELILTARTGRDYRINKKTQSSIKKAALSWSIVTWQ
jgi:hypothetical protein